MFNPFRIHEDSRNYTLDRPVTAEEIINEAKNILAAELKEHGDAFTTPDTVRQFFHLELVGEEREVFACAFLDNRHRLIHHEILFKGTIDGATVHPREVVKAALRHNAAAVIFAHNHPSGLADPSEADKRITERLKEALALMDIRVLDHFVLGAEGTVSFAEQGLM